MTGARVLGVVAATVLAASGSVTAKPFAYTSRDGRYAVQFPSGPPNATTRPAQGTSITVHFDMVQLAQDQIYTVAYGDLPADANHSGDPLDDSAYVARGELISRKDFTLFGHPARETEVLVHGDHVLRARAVDVGRRVYQVMIIVPKGEEHGATAQAFVQSFRIVAARGR